jgi:hypothetical protein
MAHSISKTLADHVPPVIATLVGIFICNVIVGVFGLGFAILGGIAAIGFVILVSARANPQKDPE